MKSLASLARILKSRVFAFMTMEDRAFSGLLSPALQSLRLVDGFVRNVLVLVTGSTFAMVIPIAAAPVLTRLYSPSDYGTFALYVSIVTIASVPVTAGYDGAIMLPRSDADAIRLSAVCVVVALLFSSALLLVAVLFPHQIAALLGDHQVSAFLLFVPAMALLMGLQGTLVCWFNRKREFRRLAANKVAESVVTPLGGILLGIQSPGAMGLIASLIGGKVVSALMLVPRAWRDKKRTGTVLGLRSMLQQARRYSDFPLYSAPASLLDAVALQAPVFLLTRSFGLSVVGLFALTTRAIGAPLALVAQSVAQVYYQWTAEARQKKTGSSYVLRIAGYLALLVSVPAAAVILFAPALFSFVFGTQWAAAGEYARVLIIPLAVRFVVSPLTVIMPVTGNIRLGSVWKVIYFASTWVVLYVACHFSAKTFLYIYAAHESVLFGLYFILVVRASAGMEGSGPLKGEFDLPAGDGV